MKGLAKWIQAVTSWTRNMWKDWLLPSGCSRSNEGKSNYFRTFVLIIFDIGGGSVRGVECNGVGSGPRMKISVIMDISVLQFYRYIGEYFEKQISISLRLIKIHGNVRKTS